MKEKLTRISHQLVQKGKELGRELFPPDDLTELTGEELDKLLSRQTRFFMGFPVGEIVTGGVLATIALSIKRIPPDFVGTRVTLEKVSREVLGPGWYLTDPTRVFQKIPLVHSAPVRVDVKGVMRNILTQANDPVDVDTVAVIEVGNPGDVARRVVGYKPTTKLGEEARVLQDVGVYSDVVMRRVIPDTLERVEEIGKPGVMSALTERGHVYLQHELDRVYLTHDPDALAEATARLENGGMPARLAYQRGIKVTNFGITDFNPAPEKVEAMVEKTAAPDRVAAEAPLAEALGDHYGVYRAARAGEQTRSMIVIPASMGEGGAAVIGRVERLSRDMGPGGPGSAPSTARERLRKVERRLSEVSQRLGG